MNQMNSNFTSSFEKEIQVQLHAIQKSGYSLALARERNQKPLQRVLSTAEPIYTKNPMKNHSKEISDF